MANQPEFAKKMVGWYHPPQLAQTAVEVAISTIFGRHSDQRLVEAMASGEKKEDDYYDYTHFYTDEGKEVCEPDLGRPRNSIWLDYVGDVGDGWNPTYAIAYYLTQPLGDLKYTSDGKTYDAPETQRGDVLIFGGDEVYPTASREVYKERLLAPYETATRTRVPPFPKGSFPHVFAIPGNHDWYDSLVAFTRLFTSRRWFAGWRTRQSRSYFALKLPHNWWLLGTDVQLGSDIDGPQVEYFEKLRKHMDEEEKNSGKRATVILCHAEPHWIRAWQYEGIDPHYSESNLKLLEKRLGKNVAVYIAGDLHHYRRHEARDQSTQKITAGGGGAFLHPTHPGLLGKKFDTIYEKDLDQEELKPEEIKKLLDNQKGLTPDEVKNLLGSQEKRTPDEIKKLLDSRVFNRRACFPTEKESARVCWRNLAFPFFGLMGNASWTLGLVTAALYLLLILPVAFITDDPGLQGSYKFSYLTYVAIRGVIGSPVTVLLILVTIVGFWLFTDSHSNWQRFLGGLLHALAHLAAAFTIALGSIAFVLYISTPDWVWRIPWSGGLGFPVDLRKLLVIFLILLGGFVAGTFIMGVYVLISLNLFGRHGNEAFSSLGIEDWKNFLRLQIDENGNLTIFPIGIRRVPRKWKPNPSTDGPEWIPDEKDTRATRPELIEEPIFMKKAATDTGAKTAPSASSA